MTRARIPENAHMAGESPLGSFVRSWSCSLDDEKRNELLLPITPRLAGTKATAEVEEARAWLATDWLIRICAPTFLGLVPELQEHAKKLSALPAILSNEAVNGAQGVFSATRSAACGVVRSAMPGDTFLSVAEGAAWGAAWSAADAASWDATSGAWSVVHSEARSAVWSAALVAVWNATRSAALSVAWSAAQGAAESAARDALQPTVNRLQESALQLLIAMIEVEV